MHISSDPAHYNPEQRGPAICLNLGNQTGQVSELMQLFPAILVSTELPKDYVIPQPPTRPLCLASVQSTVELDMMGYVTPVDSEANPDDPSTEHFLSHTPIRLPVGWESIEIYRFQAEAYWDLMRAKIWAEMDILAYSAQANLRTQSYSSLDGRGETRRQYAALLSDFESLLAGPEEPVHQFVKRHPELLCPSAEKLWSKLPFGDWVSDFVFREVANDYLLVEIEAPIRELFRKDGQQRQELTHAIKQISDWVEYIEDNKIHIETTLGLTGISASPRRLVVIGRSACLSDENRRAIVNIQNAQPKLRILTYDDVLVSARTNLERILGPLSIVGQDTQLFFFKPKA